MTPACPQPERYKQAASAIARTARQRGVRLIPVPVLPMPESEFADVPGILAYRAKYTRAAPPFIALAVRFEHFFRSECWVLSAEGRVLRAECWVLSAAD